MSLVTSSLVVCDYMWTMIVLVFVMLLSFASCQQHNITSKFGSCTFEKEPKSCSCTKECDMYGDCCLDSEYFKPERQVWGAAPFKCRKIEHIGIYFMQSCPTGKKQEYYCEHPNKNFPDMFLDVPVTSRRTNVTYINGHCAICNEDFDANVDDLWDVEFSCELPLETWPLVEKEFAKRNKSTEQFDCFPYCMLTLNGSFVDCIIFDENLEEWKLNLECAYSVYAEVSGIEGGIEVQIEETFEKCEINIIRSSKIHDKLKICDPYVIGSCPNKQNDIEAFEKCLAFQDIYRSGGQTFRNSYCAQCWEDFSITTVKYPEPPLHPIGLSFSILLSLEKLNNGNCPTGEKYDPFKHRCRTLLKVTRDVDLKEDVEQYNETNSQPNNEIRIHTTNKIILAYITLLCIPVSILCLVLHLVAFFATPKLRNLPSMNLASLSTALLLLYSCFFASVFLDSPCVVVAVFIHYSLLACFSWMLVISFDVLNAIRRTISDFQFSTGTKWSRFAVYTLAAWLFPAVLVAISLALDLTETGTDFSPGYGSTDCWIQNPLAKVIFVLTPLCVVMVFNVWFYSWTAWLIHTTRSETVENCTARTDFRLFVRLAIIMGLTWITGIIGSFVEHDAVWYVFVFLNTLQGLFIFVAFSFTKKMRSELKQVITLFNKSEPSVQITKL